MLYLVGGGLDLKDDLSILKDLLGRAKGSKICVIITASQTPVESASLYREAFFNLGAEICTILNPRTAYDAAHPPAELQNCDIVFFSGGDQLVLANVLRGTVMWQKITEHFKAGKIIAGTSAGASAMSLKMIYGPDDWTTGNPEDHVLLKKGLGLASKLIIDTHFSERNRLKRLVKIVPPEYTGIGIDEKTAAIIDKGQLSVFGSGQVFIVDGESTRIIKPNSTMPFYQVA